MGEGGEKWKCWRKNGTWYYVGQKKKKKKLKMEHQLCEWELAWAPAYCCLYVCAHTFQPVNSIILTWIACKTIISALPFYDFCLIRVAAMCHQQSAIAIAIIMVISIWQSVIQLTTVVWCVPALVTPHTCTSAHTSPPCVRPTDSASANYHSCIWFVVFISFLSMLSSFLSPACCLITRQTLTWVSYWELCILSYCAHINMTITTCLECCSYLVMCCLLREKQSYQTMENVCVLMEQSISNWRVLSVKRMLLAMQTACCCIRTGQLILTLPLNWTVLFFISLAQKQ